MLLIDLSVEEAEQYVPVHARTWPGYRVSRGPYQYTRRLEAVARYSSGFVYLVSRTGVTGERQALSRACRTARALHARR